LSIFFFFSANSIIFLNTEKKDNQANNV